LHKAYDEVWHKAEERGLRVSGSELVGLVPLKSILDAGRYFLRKQNRSTGVSDQELIKIAVKSMGLDDLYPFKPEEKIIEYVMEKGRKTKTLVDLSLMDFMNNTASESPAPGGGSVSALMGAIGTSLGTMVANLSSHKRGWDEKWEEYSNWAEKGKHIQESLMKMVDEDTLAFNRIMDTFQLPAKTEEEKNIKNLAIQEATKNAILVPFNVMKKCFEAYELIEAMARTGNPNSVSDAGVGALAIRSAIKGAWLNVKINAKELEDKAFIDEIFKSAGRILSDSDDKESAILKIVDERMV